MHVNKLGLHKKQLPNSFVQKSPQFLELKIMPRIFAFRHWKNMQRLWGKNSVLKLSAKSSCVHPNQSLKLTEPAVDDLTRAKQIATIGQDLARAEWLPSLRHFVAAA